MVQYMDRNTGFAQWNANRNANSKSPRVATWLWWAVLFVAAWWLIGVFLSPRTQNVPVTPDADAIDTSTVPVNEIQNDKITFDVRGLRISNIKLADFNRTPNDDTRVSLLGGDNDWAEIGFIANGVVAPSAATVWKNDGDVMSWRNTSGVEFRRSITTNDYVISIDDQIINKSPNDAVLTPYARIVRKNPDTSSTGVATGAISYVNGGVERNPWNKLNRKSYAYTTTDGFTGFADQYWETVVSIASPDQTIKIRRNDEQYTADVSVAPVVVPAGGVTTVTTRMFTGPRDQGVLNTANAQIHGLNRTVDYGWFWFLARPMLWVLNMLNSLVMNYGVAIILMTILLRILIWPLTRKSYTSMIAMHRMQPEMQRIQKLYANDKMRLQMEMMKLYRTHKTSPMSGCLPMLLQIPIFFALYKALLISVPMRNAAFLWISDLSVMDPYFILPILMGITMWYQGRQQNSATRDMVTNDAMATTNRIMRWMPVFFTLMFAWMPAGLVLYWTISNVFGIAQMWLLKRKK